MGKCFNRTLAPCPVTENAGHRRAYDMLEKMGIYFTRKEWKLRMFVMRAWYGIFVIALALFAGRAHAATTLYDNTNNPATGSYAYTSSGSGVYTQNVANGSSTIASGNVDHVYQFVGSYSGNVNGWVMFFANSNNNSITNFASSTSATLKTGLTIGANTGNWVDFSFIGAANASALSVVGGTNYIYSGSFVQCGLGTSLGAIQSCGFTDNPIIEKYQEPSTGHDEFIQVWYQGDPTTATTTASFMFPVTSSTIPDFTYWKVSFTAPTSTQLQGQILYQRGDTFSYTNPVYSDTFNYTTGPNETSGTMIALKTNTLWNSCSQAGLGGCGQDWIAQLYLYPINGYGPIKDTTKFRIDITSSTIQLTTSTQDVGPFWYNPFQQTPTYEFQSVTSSVAGLYNSSSTQDCPPPADWTDFGGGLYYATCRTMNYLFTPGPFTTDIVSSTIASIEAVPPYSWFFQVNNTVLAAASSTPTSSPGLSVAVPFGFGKPTTTLTLLAPDPTTVPNLNEHTPYGPHTLLELIWNATLVGFIALILYGIYKMVF